MVALVPFTAISHITFQQVTAEAEHEHSRLNPLDPVSTALAPVFSRLENGTGSRVEVHGSQRGQSAHHQQARMANLIRQKAAWQSFHPRLPVPPFLSSFLLIRSIFSPKPIQNFKRPVYWIAEISKLKLNLLCKAPSAFPDITRQSCICTRRFQHKSFKSVLGNHCCCGPGWLNYEMSSHKLS